MKKLSKTDCYEATRKWQTMYFLSIKLNYLYNIWKNKAQSTCLYTNIFHCKYRPLIF